MLKPNNDIYIGNSFREFIDLLPQLQSDDWEMINLIGQDINNINLYKDQNYILHIYGKKNVKAGRKMGHYNRNVS